MLLRCFSLLLLILSSRSQAQIPAPALQSSWLRLLHYDQGLSGPWISSISSREFFLSPTGVRDPQAEWEALLQGAQGSDAAAIACRFPARARLYEKFLGRAFPAAPCADYMEWKARLDFHSLSLVYSTAYAGNPASILGHNILKLNQSDPATRDDPESGLPLLDYGLAFLAQEDPQDGAVSYVWNGLFGGYPGFFMLQPYYELVNAYAYAENRDLWELEIRLNPDERELFLAHVWELIHQASAPYYFTHVNCSTMLVEILEAVRPEWGLRGSLPGLVLPHAVMQAVATLQGPSQESFWPSQKRIFHEHWSQLSALQQEKFMSWRRSSQLLAVADDALLLDTILHQLNLDKAHRTAAEQLSLRAMEDQVLLSRAHLPASSLRLPDRTQASNNPLLAHALHKFTLLGGRDDQGNLLALRLRWGLHDLLDQPQGFNPYYQLNFLDLRLWQTSAEDVEYRLEFVDMMALHPWERADAAGSWALACGLHREREGPRPHCRGAYGVAWEMGRERGMFYVLPGMNLTITSFVAEIRAGWYQAWTERWRQLLEIVPRQELNAGRNLRWDWSLEQRWSLNRSWQVEWRLAREDRWQSLVGVGQFF